MGKRSTERDRIFLDNNCRTQAKYLIKTVTYFHFTTLSNLWPWWYQRRPIWKCLIIIGITGEFWTSTPLSSNERPHLFLAEMLSRWLSGKSGLLA
jgi:hypothetical protein